MAEDLEHYCINAKKKDNSFNTLSKCFNDAILGVWKNNIQLYLNHNNVDM